MKVLATSASLLFVAAAALAQTATPCKTGEDLPRVPELVSNARDHKLKATIVVVADTQSIGTRTPLSAPTPASMLNCYPQTVRWIKGINTDQPYPTVPPGGTPQPMPGPTLRARVGDLVQLTFLNQIDMNRFPKSLDKGKCDAVTGIYPTNPNLKGANGEDTDHYPDCFHGSTTVNMHFHGSHVNPNTTGDNVFIEVRPSLRTQDAANAPIVTRTSVEKDFNEFFGRCEKELLPSNPTKEWPKTWDDFPKTYTEKQEWLLKEYDKTILGEEYRNLWLWPTDREQRRKGLWPQYYVGAFPYCFRIPEYTEKTGISAKAAEIHAIHAHGAGTAEDDQLDNRKLVMGQSPGTHWYHAHKHGATTINVSNGMTGAFIIEGEYDDDLNTFYGEGWTRKAKVMVINQLGTSPNLERGGPGKGQDKGATFSVNGRYFPVVHMAPGEVQMWRIVNTSSRAGAYIESLPSGFQWRQLAQDGVQFVNANYQASGTATSPAPPILLAAGNRVDLLVMAPATATTSPVALQVQYEVDPQDLAKAVKNTLLSISVDGTPATGNQTQFIPKAPDFPPFLSDVTDDEIKGTKTVQFASNPPQLGKQHTINGQQFGGEVGAVVLLNQAEEWTIQNATYGPPISHPFHIHLNPFQITAKLDPNKALSTTNGAGTVTINAPQTGNTIVTASVPFSPALNVGDWIWIGGNRATVIKVDSDTQVELPNQSFSSSTTPAAYQTAVPYYTTNVARAGQCHIDPNNAVPCGPTEPATNRIWWDVFPIPSGNTFYDANGANPVNVPGYFKMRSRFVDFDGYYVIHCHILAHEDRGMMTIVEVAPLQSPYSHH
jgi:FtsP/CotA-like multicopper oxidase with cupredoxin domain